MLIKPTVNFNEVADHYYEDMPLAIKLLLRTMGVKKHSPSSLTSYLLFERTYTQKLIELGFEDGMNRLDEMREFLELK